MTRGLRKIPIASAFVASLIKHGTGAFAGAVDAPSDLEIVDVTYSRRDDGNHRVMLFVSSASFSAPEDLKAMTGGLNVPEWNPHFPRQASVDRA